MTETSPTPNTGPNPDPTSPGPTPNEGHPLAHAEPLDIVLLLGLGAIWGASFAAIKVAVDTIPPMSVAAGRIAIGAVILLIAARVMNKALPREPRTLVLVGLVGLFNCALPFFLISWGEQQVDSALAALLMGAGPVVVVILAHFTTHDEKLTMKRALGVLLGLLGVGWVVGPEAIKGDGTLLSQLAIMAAAGCYAISGAIAKHIHGVSPVALTAAVLSAASMVVVPGSLILDQPWTLRPSTESLEALIYLGTLPTAGAFLIRYFILARAGYAFVSMTSYLVTVFGVIWGAMLLGEMITPTMIGALVLVMGGVALMRPPGLSVRKGG